MKRFQLSALTALSDLPISGSAERLAGAADSVAFFQANAAAKDQIVIYSSRKSVQIHGVLAEQKKVASPDGHDLQDERFPQTDEGISPIDYLTGWRMMVARSPLKIGGGPVAAWRRSWATCRTRRLARRSSALRGVSPASFRDAGD